MQFWSPFLLLTTLVTALFGYSGVAGASAEIAKILSGCFLAASMGLLAVNALLRGPARHDGPEDKERQTSRRG